MATSQRLEQIASVLAGPVGSACTLKLYDHEEEASYQVTLVRQLINLEDAKGSNSESKAARHKSQDCLPTHHSLLGVLLGALYGLVCHNIAKITFTLHNPR